MNIFIINGPNLNLLGIRNPDIYGLKSYKDLSKFLKEECKKREFKVKIFQSNSEAKIINIIHQAYYKKIDAIIINAAAYSHYSIAIRDAIEAVGITCIEVHLSDIYKRENFRQVSLISDVSKKVFVGAGFNSYLQALDYLKGDNNV